MNLDKEAFGMRNGSRNVLSILVGILVISSAALTFVPSAEAQSMGQLEPPYSDNGLDTDLPPDGLFDHLVVNVSINVTQPGDFVLVSELRDNAGIIYITDAFNFTWLDVGVHVVPLWYTGYAIRLSGIDGPYVVNMGLLNDTFAMIDSGSYLTGPYLAQDFQTTPAGLLPPHSDHGMDTDSDTLFNFLVIDVAVDVSEAGFYDVGAALLDGTGMIFIDFESNYTYLDVGLQTVVLRYRGYVIYSAGVDGPYRVELELYDDSWNFLDNGTHMTQAYLHTDFEQTLPAEFSPPHSDYGLDGDGDTLYDFLVVDVTLNVDEAGLYEIWGDLYDSTGMIYITDVGDFFDLDPGLQTVELQFLGYDIYDAGIDGPYTVELMLFDYDMNLLDTDTHVTSAYLHTEFDPRPGRFSPPHSDHGLDTDVPTDGFFDLLVLNASVDIDEPGMFLVQGILFDGTMTLQLMGTNFTQLAVGLQTVELSFGGPGIYTSGFDGPYFVMLMLGTFVGEDMAMVDQDFYVTNPYNYTDFQPVNPGMIWGYVYEAATGSPLPSAEVQAFNYTYGHSNRALTDPTGYYEMNLFEGEFHVLLDDSDLQSDLTVVPVVGSTEVTAYLEESPPMSMSSDISFLDWDNANLSADMTMEEDNQTMRVMIDFMYGNRDGYLDQGELDLFLGLVGGPPGEFDNTTEIMFVDGIHYDLDPASFQFDIGGEGPVDLKTPFSMHLSGNYTSNVTIPVAPSHLIELNMTYDTDEEVSMGYMNIPATYVLDAFDPVSNMSISGLGTSAILIDPLGDPDPGDGVDYVWVNLTVTATTGLFAPEVRDVFIDGSSVTTYYLSALPTTFDFTAIVDDTLSGNSNIGGANYTTPTPATWPGTPMSAIDGAFDEPVEDVNATVPIPASPGIYDYYVHAWDSIPTFNGSAPYATLTIVDDLLPEISGVAIDGQSAVIYNLSSLPSSVTLTAVVNDTGSGGSDIGGANYTTPAAATWPGTPMQAEDGTFDSPVEIVTAQVVPPTQAGTYDYYVYAWDTGEGYNDSAPFATLTVVDDLPPEISNVRVDGQTSVMVGSGTEVVLTATIDDTGTGNSNIAAANYTIGVMNWPGTPLSSSDGAFDSPQEDVNITIDTTGWTDGSYEICVYAQDSGEGYNNTAPFATLTIVDDHPPEISEVAIDGQSVATYYLSSLPSVVVLTATVDDTNTGDSNIGGANYTTPAAMSWPGTAMQAEDGTFDSPVENVTAQVVLPTQAGTYDYYVYGWDDGAGYNDSAPNATLTIVDDLPPEISNVRVDGHRAVTVTPGTDVLLTAVIDDTSTGDADIGAANYTIGLTDWPGTAMDPTDGSFDSAQEDVSVLIDTSGWSEGSYQVCVYASDSGPAHNTTAVECAEIVIDETPPSIDDVLAEPDPQDAEEEVVVSASITDANGIAEVRIEIRDPEGSLVGNFSMTYGVAEKYEHTRAYDATGTYTFTIWATDEAGNVASESGDFSIQGEASAGFLEQYWWIILIVVIAVVILVALVALRRKPVVAGDEEMPPPPEEEIPPPPEEELP